MKLSDYILKHPSNFINVYTMNHTDEQRNKFVAVNFGRANTEISLAIYGPEFIWCKTNQKKFGGMFGYTLYSIDDAKKFIDQIGNS